MNEKDFVKWLSGFAQGVHHYNLTPKQWDYVKEVLSEVGETENTSYSVDSRLWTTTTT